MISGDVSSSMAVESVVCVLCVEFVLMKSAKDRRVIFTVTDSPVMESVIIAGVKIVLVFW